MSSYRNIKCWYVRGASSNKEGGYEVDLPGALLLEQVRFLTLTFETIISYVQVRKQLEIFEALPEDVESNTQGRKKQVVLGQVGIRCRYVQYRLACFATRCTGFLLRRVTTLML